MRRKSKRNDFFKNSAKIFGVPGAEILSDPEIRIARKKIGFKTFHFVQFPTETETGWSQWRVSTNLYKFLNLDHRSPTLLPYKVCSAKIFSIGESADGTGSRSQ